jgi:protoporphyrinogen IX oxidase
MSPDALLWTKTLHIFGTLMWFGCLFGLYQLIYAHGKADEAGRKALADIERKMAIAMDVGATLTIAGGVAMIFGIGASVVMKAPWMHIKLTLVAFMLAAHVYARIKIKKFGKGDTSTPPEALLALLNFFLVGILIMAIVKPIK